MMFAASFFRVGERQRKGYCGGIMGATGYAAII